MSWKEKEITLVIYDVHGNEHALTITRKESVGIIKSLAEDLKYS